MCRLTAAVLCLGLLAPFAAAQKVWVVDDTPSSNPDFNNLQPAIDAASDGDIILVRDGEYPAAMAIDGKALTVIADSGASVHLMGIRVRNLAATQSVTLAGLRVGPGPSFSPGEEVLRVTDCAGPVLLQDLVIDGALSYALLPLKPTVTISDCAAVTFEGGSITGRRNTAYLQPTDGLTTEALVCTSSQVQLAHDRVTGAHGTDANETADTFFPPVAGDTAVRLADSRLILLGSSVVGGEGGQGAYNFFVQACTQGAGGGAAIVFDDAACEVVTRAAEVSGGPGGTGGFNIGDSTFCDGGPAGDDIVGPGAVTALSGGGDALDLHPSVVRAGSSGTLTLHGSPGSGALLIVGFGQAQLWLPVHAGVLLPAPLVLVPVGPVPPSGALSLSYAAPTLPAGVDGIVAVLQAAFTVGGPAQLGGGGALVVLDASF